MSTPKQSATQRMKGQAECILLMALSNCLDAIEAGLAEKASSEARTVTRFALMLNPKLRVYR